MYLVVFRNRKRAGMDVAAYAADAERMEALAAAQPGFFSVRSYTSDDGEVVTISEWADRDAARSWGRHADHALVQRRGMDSYYEEFTLFACEDPQVRNFKRT